MYYVVFLLIIFINSFVKNLTCEHLELMRKKVGMGLGNCTNS